MAEIFDQYIVYRPRWIGDWERGQQPLDLADNSQARWQATLWQVLTQRYGTQHRAKLRADFFQKVRQLTTRAMKLESPCWSSLAFTPTYQIAEVRKVS